MLHSVALAFAGLVAFVQGYNNGEAIRPAMGWNTWCTIDSCGTDYCYEDEIKQIASAMLANGLYSAGYKHINFDDCWASEHRDANGSITWDPDRFPNGLPNLIDWLHDKGFKFGLYTSAGNKTCSSGGRGGYVPGSYGYYTEDANTFASWGVDYVKIDWCGGDLYNSTQQHTEFSEALNKTGRHIWLELCRGYQSPNNPPYVAQVANSWRIDGDHHDDWSNTLEAIESAAGNTGLSGMYNWAYMDFLMTGGQGCSDTRVSDDHCPGMSDDEYRTEFSLWSIVASPLIVATAVNNMTDIMDEVLLNIEIIAINQENQTPAGDRILVDDCDANVKDACEVWTRKMSDGSIGVILFNKADSNNHTITINFSNLGMNWNSETTLKIRDLWKHEDLGEIKGSFSSMIGPHAVTFVRMYPTA